MTHIGVACSLQLESRDERSDLTSEALRLFPMRAVTGTFVDHEPRRLDRTTQLVLLAPSGERVAIAPHEQCRHRDLFARSAAKSMVRYGCSAACHTRAGTFNDSPTTVSKNSGGTG